MANERRDWDMGIGCEALQNLRTDADGPPPCMPTKRSLLRKKAVAILVAFVPYGPGDLRHGGGPSLVVRFAERGCHP